MAVPVHRDPDWSDSDEEDDRSDIETSVLLGIPDGLIEKQEDLDDAAVSRIGGHPAFLPTTEPPLSSSQCKNCSFPMELLVQLWSPFENSTMDRALYVFGCARGECQHKPGSVRAFRGLRFNAAYAAKLEKKKAQQREKEAARREAAEEANKRKEAAKVNPFSMNTSSTPTGGLFGAAPSFGGSGLGTQLFGSSEPTSELQGENDDAAPPPPESEPEDSDEDSDSEAESTPSVLAAPTQKPSSTSPWSSIPSYTPAFYLSTATEYVPPAPKPKVPIAAVDDEDDDIGAGLGKSKKAEARRAEKEKKGQDELKGWESAMEGYEDSMEVDKVFERFARIAGYEGEQCIRYELGGIPLPYSNDTIFKSLFPSSPSTSSSSISTSTKFTPATPANNANTPARRTYNPTQPSLIPPCPRCTAPRTFECQLMPHLISVLHSSSTSSNSTTTSSKAPTESSPSTALPPNDQRAIEQRKRELESLLHPSGGNNDKRGIGMEWGTCMIFSCSKDCRLAEPQGSKEEKEMREEREVWAEEVVLIQWDE
ncbi:uncharacterized protein FOMMEDRAFT_137786 [Fomitiporia mediterranea MF3/22]|uniref:uncharacterized protein n=1 Tax=Fomitiporia mediterranea (strain MF3/22) TaxID=694068 RepID=UPI00044087F9|nr:uncharacterized protein FOMMEDRAFT_137786 [Fomitiporia mediterranea MF3/22]EJD07484.1 hypothetical protein FOMMEDRAFT_137786 [Fomitiporia mediterranea MF3/22]